MKSKQETLDLSHCLDLNDKDNILIEEDDLEELVVSAQLWLYDHQYIEILNRTDAPERLNQSSHDIVCESDIIVNVYAYLTEKAVNLIAFVDTNELCKDYSIELTEAEIATLKACFNDALLKQYNKTLDETLRKD